MLLQTTPTRPGELVKVPSSWTLFQNLKSLEISRACTTDSDGEDTGLSPKNFYSLFATENMKNLENLCLDGSDALYMNEEKQVIFIFVSICNISSAFDNIRESLKILIYPPKIAVWMRKTKPAKQN